MTTKNQITQTNSSNSNIVELSDKDLQQIVGGGSIPPRDVPPRNRR